MADNSPISNSSDGESTPPRNPTPSIIDFLSMGVASALCLILGGGIGYGIDALAGTSPILTFVGLAFGVVAAVLVTVTQVRKYL
jgi:F0F1-type ATP synthase assembly protein I